MEHSKIYIKKYFNDFKNNFWYIFIIAIILSIYKNKSLYYVLLNLTFKTITDFWNKLNLKQKQQILIL